LHAVNLNPTSSTKVAAFDLDGTLIEFGFDKAEWELKSWNPCVPVKLAEAAREG
jgi:bifunctional polynucleotide phosphatase/kinase